MALSGLSTKTNTIAVIVHEGSGLQILSNGVTIHPAGGKDNNPTAKFISQLAEPLAQSEQIEDPTLRDNFRSAIADQIQHAMFANQPGQSSHHVLTCSQMRQQIAVLQRQAAATADPRKHAALEKLIDSDLAVVDHMCNGAAAP